MKKFSILGLIAGAILASATIASAHGTACCEGKACPAGLTAYPGETPGDAKCCDDAGTCTATPNAGWACNSDPATNLQAIPDRQAFAGCVDGEMGVCVGGAVGPDGQGGCVGVGVAFVAGMNPSGTAEDCTNAAVDACCAADACVVAPAD
jgi:hypothetical protein